jgi:hypothetical protein
MRDASEARDADAGDLRHTSRRLGKALGALALALAALVLLERFGALALGTHAPEPGHDAAGRWLRAAAHALPEMLSVLALWWIRGALAEFAAGEFFTPALAKALRRAGFALAIAAAFSVALLPSIEGALGWPPGYVIAFDVRTFVLGAVGIALTLIAHVLMRAALLQAELDEIF